MAEELEKTMTVEMRDQAVSQYLTHLKLDTLKNRDLRETIKNTDLRYNTFSRITNSISYVKLSLTAYKTRTAAICLKVTHKNLRTIFGYVYASCIDNKIDYESVCIGPTYHSIDGEYRSRLISWAQYNNFVKKFQEKYELVEERITERLREKDISFEVEVYNPISCKMTEAKLKRDVHNIRLPVMLFVMCWIADVYLLYYDVEENHINETYKEILLQDEDVALFEQLLKEVGKETLYLMSMQCSNYFRTRNDPILRRAPPRCGQKIFPMSPMEVIKTDDINYSVWREIYATSLASNLVLNFISPSFPFINNWFYIQEAGPTLFDNPLIHELFVYSDIATEISNQLLETDRLNYVNALRSNGPISGKLAKISRDIHLAIHDADTNVRLSDLAICMTSEWVGRTLRDIPAIIGNSEGVSALENMFSDKRMFCKHLFEFIYAFYCMNSRMGIIHSDLHLNNVTIYMLYDFYNSERYATQPVHNGKILYIAAGVPYLFDHNGMFSMIIDFSKAILGDMERLEHEFGQAYTDIFLSNQRERVIHLMEVYFTDFMKQKGDHFKILLTKSFPLLFKILSVLDTYVITSNFRHMIKIDNVFTSGRAKIAEGIMELLERIIFQAEDLILDNLELMFSGELKSVEQLEWPNLKILSENFSEFVFDGKLGEGQMLCDVFNSDLDIEYDVDGYENWGPLLSMDIPISVWKKHGVYEEYSKRGAFRNWVEFEATDETDTMEKLVENYKKKEAEMLQFEEWMIL